MYSHLHSRYYCGILLTRITIEEHVFIFIHLFSLISTPFSLIFSFYTRLKVFKMINIICPFYRLLSISLLLFFNFIIIIYKRNSKSILFFLNIYDNSNADEMILMTMSAWSSPPTRGKGFCLIFSKSYIWLNQRAFLTCEVKVTYHLC